MLYFTALALSLGRKFTTLARWESFLKERNITQKAEMRFLTEAALYASLIQKGISKKLGVHSDDAWQFYIFVHSLCWIHEERHYRKLIMTTDESRADLVRQVARGQFQIVFLLFSIDPLCQILLRT